MNADQIYNSFIREMASHGHATADVTKIHKYLLHKLADAQARVLWLESRLIALESRLGAGPHVASCECEDCIDATVECSGEDSA